MGKSHVGVEITEESVRAVEVTLDRTPQVIAYGEVPLPPEAAHDSEVLDEGTVALAIRQLWATSGIHGKNATLGVASRRVLVREYSTQVMAPELLRQALPYQVQDLLPVPVNQAVLDYYPTSQDGEQLHGLLVAAVSETVEGMIAAFDRAKIRIAGVDLATFGLSRAASLIAPAGTHAVVHVGDHTTQVLIQRDGAPEFVRITPVDLETAAVRRRSAVTSITDDGTLTPAESTSSALLDPARVAAGALQESAAGSAGILPAGALRGDIGPKPVADVIGRIRGTISFYLNRPGATRIEGVLICGAGSAVDGVLRGLVEVLDVPVRQISLGDVVSVRGAAPIGEHGLNLVSTLGLALRGDR
ncbi:pilus assembly protein PilM [Microbacterium sp. NPDC089321]|uniref:type IV pilus biogenesis protein PilM n=1 Tax=Microbacterium sp. NPDC089321 TaxID=3155183 RepID=UPI00341FA769